MPCDYKRYPVEWPAIRARILARAAHVCEQCGAPNYQPHPVTGSRVVLTIAHLPEATSTMDCRDEVLLALCQRCHNRLDSPMRQQHAAATRRAKRAAAGEQALPLDVSA